MKIAVDSCKDLQTGLSAGSNLHGCEKESLLLGGFVEIFASCSSCQALLKGGLLFVQTFRPEPQ